MNSGLCACEASTLPTKLYPHPCCAFFEIGFHLTSTLGIPGFQEGRHLAVDGQNLKLLCLSIILPHLICSCVSVHFLEVMSRWLLRLTPWSLLPRVKESGGLLLTRRLENLWELQPSFDIVVNCSGLGSQQLAGDSMISPVRGQLLQVQAPWVKHFIRDGSGLTYIYPGTSHVTLGGTRQKGDWNLSPDAQISRDIFSRCCVLEPSLHRACIIKEKVGLRPFRPGVRLQKELLARGGRRLPVVHHYGHGSGGVSVHWGSAMEAARLVSECVQALRIPSPTSKL